MMIDYSKKLTKDREFYPIKDLDYSIESDRGRILSSAAFRRLQKRTQVFALELNASIRTRLTHSLEVAQTARFIAKSILFRLSEKEKQNYALTGLENAFISTAEMTSLLHDIGNPPFGHFAEQTINKWARENVIATLKNFNATSKEAKELQKMLMEDICNYDGNAQAIRIITKLQRLNLSYTQTLAVLKYTRGAFAPRPSRGESFDYLMKKPGYYYSEKDFIKKLQETLGVKEGHRFPITYIMEAADDISYLTADLEDSVAKGILSLQKVYNLIKEACHQEKEDYLLDVIEKKYQKAQQNEEPYQFNMFFTLTRAQLVTDLVKHVTEVYVTNHETIFHGEFNSALLEYEKQSKYYKAIKILQNISTKHIYENKEVQQLELQGYAIVNGLLNIYQPLLTLTCKEFQDLLAGKNVACFLAPRLIQRISSKQIVAYQNDFKNLQEDETLEMLEFYYRVRLIIDFISGMTDDFALAEYQLLSANGSLS